MSATTPEVPPARVRKTAARVTLGVCWVILIGLSAQLRIVAALHTEVDLPLRADAGEYFRYAYNLMRFGVYSRGGARPGEATAPPPDAVRAPGYPLLLAVLMDDPPTRRTLQRIVVVQALLGVAVVALVFAMSRALLPLPFAFTAALLTAISPHLINAGVYILSETLFSLTVMIALSVFARIGRADSPIGLFAVGILLAVCALVRPTLLYFPLILAAVLLVQSKARRETVIAVTAMFLGFGLTYAPWPVRNLAQLGTAGDSTLQISVLHHGLYPGFLYNDDPKTYGYPLQFDPRTPEISANMHSVLSEVARRFKEAPARQLRWYILGKPMYLWAWENSAQGGGDAFIYSVTRSPYFDSGWFDFTRSIAKACDWPVLVLAAYFCLIVWSDRFCRMPTVHGVLTVRILAALLLYTTALHMIGAPFPRYGTPFRPELYLVACAAVFLLWRFFANRMRARAHAMPDLE